MLVTVVALVVLDLPILVFEVVLAMVVAEDQVLVATGIRTAVDCMDSLPQLTMTSRGSMHQRAPGRFSLVSHRPLLNFEDVVERLRSRIVKSRGQDTMGLAQPGRWLGAAARNVTWTGTERHSLEIYETVSFYVNATDVGLWNGLPTLYVFYTCMVLCFPSRVMAIPFSSRCLRLSAQIKHDSPL